MPNNSYEWIPTANTYTVTVTPNTNYASVNFETPSVAPENELDEWRRNLNRAKTLEKPKNTVHSKVVAGVLRNLPQRIKELMIEHGPKIVLAGGTIRAVAAGEPIRDYDLFVPNRAFARQLIDELVPRTGDDFTAHEWFETKNAWNVKWESFDPIGQNWNEGTHIQFVFYLPFTSPEEVAKDFDFIMSKAAIWYDQTTQKWVSWCDAEFEGDVKDKILNFTPNERNKGKLTSLKRAFKFTKMGWTLPKKSLIGIMSNYNDSIPPEKYSELLEAQYDE